jgi:hypothetical protein
MTNTVDVDIAECFAQFVFEQFGALWMSNDPVKQGIASLLPPTVERRVSELAEEFYGHSPLEAP